uniref:Protocadherin-16-like Dachsous n=1 Tax=Phallusia mammillata TaxID=59560 RepID=A0A6F9DBE3_9ASCI|nr:protocadherin-16-like Dachsous [Phallusia mammillata]
MGSTVIIVDVEDVNDNKPSINVIFLENDKAEVSEAAEVGDYIARVSLSDPDLGEISEFNVTLQGGDGKFGVQSDSGIIYLVCVEGALDRETQDSYHLTLNATDLGSPPQVASVSFTVTITDFNDNPPEFEDQLYERELSEEAFPGTFVIQLEATDRDLGSNAEVTYRFHTSEQSDWFDINEDSGLITTALNLNHDVASEVRLVVIATDKGIPPLSSNTTLLVRIMDTFDRAPEFEKSSYSVSVREDSVNGTCFFQVRALDPDSSSSSSPSITYSLVIGGDSDVGSPFEVREDSGWICLASGLDREQRDEYTFEVQATEQGGQWDRSRVHVTVSDVNDHSPVFHPVTYDVNVDRSIAEVGTPVTLLTATDRDDPEGSGFGRVTFNVMTGNEDDLFELNALTGQLSVAKPLHSIGVGSVHRLEVGAVDGGSVGAEENATVSISVIDGGSTGGPTFTSSLYSIEITEGLMESATIGRISASMEGGESVAYSIRRDPPFTTWFTVDPNTGHLNVSSDADREILSSSRFQVVAAAGTPPIYGFSTVEVNIRDVNDNAPKFDAQSLTAVTLPYTLAQGSTVRVIRAVDTDDAENGTVRYRTSSRMFSIDEETGRLILSRNMPQQNAEYRVLIEAYDLGVLSLTSSFELLVVARRPNVNCPVFSTSQSATRLQEDFATSLVFTSVQANTANTSARVIYSLVSSSDAVPFAIYPNGSLYLRQGLDYETKSTYLLQVHAQGFPSSPLADMAEFCVTSLTLNVLIDDVNDNPPRFGQTVYNFQVTENGPPDERVGEVVAKDLDGNGEAKISFSLSVPNTRFYIDSSSGVIYTTFGLDFEETQSYTFVVEASDGDHLATTTVYVTVNDVNDNAPTFFIPGGQLTVVSRLAGAGTWVADSKAGDADGTDNARLTYSFVTDQSLFDVDANSGSVTVKSGFTQNSLGVHSLEVKAEDHGSPRRSSVVPLQVRVHEDGENPAQFDVNAFVFQPQEVARPGDILGSFASPEARRRRSTLFTATYRIDSGNEDGAFHVDPTSGDVTLLRRLNFEKRPQYSLTVERRNPDGTVSTLLAQINVRDANDHTPTFKVGRAVFSVAENTPSGIEVYRFRATDLDSAEDGHVIYSLVSQIPVDAFALNAENGALTVLGELDREKITEYVVVVNASDRSRASPRSSTASAVVVLTDVNDNAPSFVSRESTFVMEDEPVGFPLLWVAADDPDFGVNGRVTYGLTSATSDGEGLSPDEELSMFHMDSTTGIVTLTKQLDYERATLHVLNISATDQATRNQKTSYLAIQVHVMDVNDVTPRFEFSIYETEVTEEQDAGVIVAKVTALDQDTGVYGELTYQLQASTDSSPFTIDSENGVITTTEKLDRETKAFYSLTVYVQDGGFPSLYDWCTVEVTVLDVNDNSPKFEPLDGSVDPPILITLDIPEFVEGPALVHTVIATDADVGNNGQIVYTIADGNTGDDFFVNGPTGELWTSRRLDRETTASYRLKLVATDQGTPDVRHAEAIVEVNVLDFNDNDPQFVESSYSANVMEELSPGQYVTTVRATDADEGLNAVVSYFFGIHGNSSLFNIDIVTGVITTAAPLDAETSPVHVLTVVAVDSAPYMPRRNYVTVTVNVLDTNDNDPVFDLNLVSINVSSSEKPSMQVGMVHATDADSGKNGEVVYRFADDSNSDGIFEIELTSGIIRIAGSFPSPLVPKYSLQVIASDSGDEPRHAVAIVDVSVLNVPLSGKVIAFEKPSYDVQMSETVQDDHVVEQVGITGATCEALTYSLPSSFGGAFGISEDGEITVEKKESLDYETRREINLIVKAVCDGVYAYATVAIQLLDENDNVPVFSNKLYETSVHEGYKEGLYVTFVKAIDADTGDNGRVRYSLESEEAFQIDEITGFLSTSRELDRETQSQYDLTVYAHDLGVNRLTSSSSIQIKVNDANDHAPTISVPRNDIVISEDAAVGTVITSVQAHDVDTGPTPNVTFRPGGNPGYFFNLNSISGELILAKPLDYEIARNITLQFNSSDGKYKDTAAFNVIVTDINDNHPVFDQQSYQASVKELSPVNTTVVRVKARDDDSGENGRVSYRLNDTIPHTTLFAIDPDTGVIRTTRIEAHQRQSYVFNLEVQAYDHGTNSLTQSVSVRIQVKDINDNAPIFRQNIYKGTVTESAVPNTSVINVTSSDADFMPRNRDVFYKIVAGNINNAFKVRTIEVSHDQVIGEICLARELDRETVSDYTLTVSAMDRGKPQLSSNATVMIHVHDVNDNRPGFNASYYRGSVQENNRTKTRAPQPVLSIYANDADSTSDFKFKIIAGNELEAFELRDCENHYSSCAQVAAKFVDFEVRNHYELTVQVSDARNSILAKTSTVGVTVDVEDVNEYPPEFQQIFYWEEVPEQTKANTTILRVQADDLDGGEFGRVTYSLASSSEFCPQSRDLLRVNPYTGDIYAIRDIDYEECENFRLKVIAVDASGEKSDEVAVSIQVTPVDEHAPDFGDEFAEENPRFVVPYGSPVGFVVGQVNATDGDSGVHGKIRYSLDESSSNYFVVNDSTGVISLARSVDNGNSRIILLTAESSPSQRSSIHITVDISNTPPIALEAQILSIVFGIIAFIACLIVAALCLKHCRNRRARDAAKTEVKSQTTEGSGRMVPDGSPDQAPFYELGNGRQQGAPGVTVQGNGKLANGNRSAGDYQTRKYNSTSMSTGNGVTTNGTKKNKQQLHINPSPDSHMNLGESANSVDLKRILRHRLMKPHEPLHTGNDGSVEDDEVHRITSTSSSSGRQSSSTSLISDKKARVADSGIQQDMDRMSFDAGVTTQNSLTQSESIESIREFGSDQVHAPQHDDVTTAAYGSHVNDMSGGGEEMAPAIDSLAPDIRIPVHLPAALGSLDEARTEHPPEQLQDWTPEFQPLTSVFSEIARLREESDAIRQAAAKHQQQHARTLAAASAGGSRASNTSSVMSDNQNRPPPLLTTIPQHLGNIAAPVPITSTGGGAKHNIDLGHVPLKGLHPRPNPHYHQQGPTTSQPLRNHPAGVPPPYSYVMSTRPAKPKSRGSSKGSRSITPPSGQPTADSLPHTPNSHESSFTSPAMSPSLSPSLSPLAERAPVDSPHVSLSSSANVSRSRSDESNLSTRRQPERMVHV